MIIALGCDHIATQQKMFLSLQLKNQGHQIIDCGTYDEARTHYPIFARRVVFEILNKRAQMGILICGTGVGISIAANKHKGIRAALVNDISSAKYARQKLNANILGMGAVVLGNHLIQSIAEAFIQTPFDTSNQKLVDKIDSLIENSPKDKDPDALFRDELRKWDNGEYND